MKKILNVFFAISNTYIQHFTVAVTSLLDNNKDLDITIFLIHDSIDMVAMGPAVELLKNKYNAGINFIDIGPVDFSIFKTDRFPKHTYFRLFLAQIAPANVDTALFLDADLVVTGSVRELAEIDPEGQYIYAVSEASVNDNVKRLNDLGFPVKSYFNAGVLLINLKAWRKENLVSKFVAIANNFMDKLEWVDQDILNAYFANNWVKLNKKYNSVHLIKKLPATPIIIHYASFSKPWQYLDTHPYNDVYWRYLQLTPFSRYKAQGFTLKNFMLKNGRLFKRRLREMGILKYEPYPAQA